MPNNKYKIVFLFLMFSQLSVQAQGQLVCSELFTDYYKGVQQATKGNHEFFFLGSGEMGGVVRRVINLKTKESELEKKYYEPEGLFNDVAALKILGRLSESELVVQIRQPKRIQADEVLYFDDVKGYPLDRLPGTFNHLKLKEEFQYWALKVFERAKKTPNMETNHLSQGNYWMSYRVPIAERKYFNGLSVIDIILKPDNIIYDTHLRQMILFDPF